MLWDLRVQKITQKKSAREAAHNIPYTRRLKTVGNEPATDHAKMKGDLPDSPDEGEDNQIEAFTNQRPGSSPNKKRRV